MQTYDICILCASGDSGEAQTLASSIKSYRIPGGAAVPAGVDYRRVVVETDDEPLDERSRAVLEGSRWLLVLCSPLSRASAAVSDKLACFRGYHGGEDLIAVLLSGEPADVMPEGFIEQKPVSRILPDMTVVERIEQIEPVAADLRADTPARKKQLLRYETTRIVATVLDLHPDELEQRHQARARRNSLTAVAAAAVVCLTAAGIFARLGLIAAREGDIARQQTEQAVHVAERTIRELPERFAGDEQALAYIEESIEAARASLEELGLTGLMDGEAGD